MVKRQRCPKGVQHSEPLWTLSQVPRAMLQWAVKVEFFYQERVDRGKEPGPTSALGRISYQAK